MNGWKHALLISPLYVESGAVIYFNDDGRPSYTSCRALSNSDDTSWEERDQLDIVNLCDVRREMLRLLKNYNLFKGLYT